MVKRGHGVPAIGVARDTSDHARLRERAKDSPEQHGGLDRATFAKLAEGNAELGAVLNPIDSGCFARGDREVFLPLVDNLLNSDPFLVLADYADYVAGQERVSAAWAEPERWTRMSILNTARAGKFSSDRAIREYAQRIWGAKPVPLRLG